MKTRQMLFELKTAIQTSTPMRSSKRLCYIAMNTLERHLNKQQPDQELLKEIPGDIECPLFVTYHKNGDDLRGCIGNLSGLNLREGLPKYAIIAAVDDPRFPPISLSELQSLDVAVSLLVDYESCGALDWQVGTHGIIIKYKGRSAVFLPEVAEEQGWDQKTTIQHLLLKAGVREQLNDKMVPEITATRFQSSKEKITYSEYLDMKKAQ